MASQSEDRPGGPTTHHSPLTTHPLANLGGEIMPLGEARVSALDRGFLFGDAVYEVLRVYGGRPWLEEEHFHRLAYSLRSIRIEGIDLQRLRQRMHQTLAASAAREATIYIQITRGDAPRSHPFPGGATPLEFLFVQEFNDPYQEVRRTGARALLHADIRWDRCDIKSTNLLGNVLAMQAAREAGCVEAVLYLPDGTLTEGTHSSLFGVRDGAVLTCPTSHDILPGITRRLVLRLADQVGVPVCERRMSRDELGQVSELFLTGTTTEVMPVVELDGQPVGTGQPGPVTRQIQEAYSRAVRAFVDTGKLPL
jgi:D-alanine transaminase